MSQHDRAILSLLHTRLTAPGVTKAVRAELMLLVRSIEEGRHLGLR